MRTKKCLEAAVDAERFSLNETEWTAAGITWLMNLRERTGPDDGLLGGPRESDLIKRVAVDGPEVKPSGSRYSKWVQLVHNQGHQQNQEEISIRTRTRNKPPSEPEETSIRTREKVNQNQNQDRMIWGTEIRLIQGRFCSWIQSSSGCFLFQVLVTVPLTLLQRGLLHFHPPLPERKLKAIHSLGAGIIEKIALQFPTRFWDSKIQGADYFGHIPPAPEKRGLFSVFYDLDPQGKQAVLMSVISGDAVPAVCELEDQEVVGECLKVLRELFPEQDVPDPVNYFVTHWSKDRWSQMSYSFVKTGGSGEAYDVLAEDVQGKLFFAGEATNQHFPQTVTGAYLSGVREASKMAAV
ncbi:lysine-specific histone demethylase 2-like isoform 1-T1 [Menidia menidia]